MTKTTLKIRGCLSKIFAMMGILLVVLAAAAYALLAVSPVPEKSSFDFDLARIRAMVMEDSEPLPLRLNALKIAEGSFPQLLTLAGGNLNPQRMAMVSYQLIYTDGSIVFDPVCAPEDFEKAFRGQPYDREKYNQLQEGLRKSSLIFTTHEHFDHIGGIARSPYLAEIESKVRLTRAQIENTGSETGFTNEMLARLTPLEAGHYHRAAPGVVLIQAPGHSPGGQLIYIQLQNGAEYLLTGDAAWNALNLERLTGRPLATSLVLREDRAETASELRTLYDLSRSEPLNLIIAHDSNQLDNLTQSGLLGSQFE